MLALGLLLVIAVLGPSNDRSGAEHVIADINHHRDEAHERALREDPTLDDIALERADDMEQRGYFDHVTPEGTTAYVDLLRGHKYRFGAAAENIALTPSVPDAEFALWLSPGHRENILGPAYRRVGVAVVHGRNGKIYTVEVFSD